MSGIVVRGVSKSFKGRRVLDDISFIVPPDSLCVLCGPPHAGKSVLLRLLVGLETPDAGALLLDGLPLERIEPGDRPIGYVPQSFALFPHLSVFDNIAYPLRMQRAAPGEITRRVDEAATLLRITRLLAKLPSQLSGGEKQRVAIARGMLKRARAFVLDDPLVGLDFKLREALMDELKDLRAVLGATFLYATSDSLEALAMADRLLVLDAGRLVADGDADAVYHAPPHLRAAELIGFPRCNVLPGRREGGACVTSLGTLPVPESGAGDALSVAVRPEQIMLLPPGMQPVRGLGGVARVGLIENLGAESVVYLDVPGLRLVAVPANDAIAGLEVGQEVSFAIPSAELAMFDTATGRPAAGGASR
ncbi:ABC transporter ATP-binding protein [Rhizosaccharibacter radicis]|uniref:ABC transporter ATP-binding protein n=1 Tax=Rhizosaccharibacter radicis TaxID=2782605 RepID=A0ABT1W1W7_9PROT|nr:ABC transporter ATP-binding protein [Acetobacteraceae bacterium KSS12]